MATTLMAGMAYVIAGQTRVERSLADRRIATRAVEDALLAVAGGETLEKAAAEAQGRHGVRVALARVESKEQSPAAWVRARAKVGQSVVELTGPVGKGGGR